jgi:methylglutaconyl-CoA hydratase
MDGGDHDPALPELRRDGRVARITLRDPARRNALDERSIARLEAVIREASALCERTGAGDGAADEAVDLVVVAGEGAAFSSGFDLAACADEPRRVEPLLAGLSACVRALRGVPAPVVARVQGAALAGGCALLTGCDFVVVAPDAQLGYPVHRIGISPAVSAPSLFSRMGPRARALMLSGEIVDGARAAREGLATHVSRDAGSLDAEVDALVERLLAKGPLALRATKAWIARIEELGAGDLGRAPGRDDDAFAATRDASMALAAGDEFATMLRAFWSSRRGAR